MNSPLNFFGSLASIAGFGTANNAMSQAAQAAQQLQQSTGTTGGALSNATAGATPNAGMLSGVNTQGSGDMESRITALEQNAPSNTLGNAKPVFNSQAQQAAQGVYGSCDQRQNSVGAAPLFKKCSKKY